MDQNTFDEDVIMSAEKEEESIYAAARRRQLLYLAWLDAEKERDPSLQSFEIGTRYTKWLEENGYDYKGNPVIPNPTLP